MIEHTLYIVLAYAIKKVCIERTMATDVMPALEVRDLVELDSFLTVGSNLSSQLLTSPLAPFFQLDLIDDIAVFNYNDIIPLPSRVYLLFIVVRQ